jgi:hypothetical protein
MRSRNSVLIAILIAGLLGSVVGSALAGTTGNIRGKITDLQTGETLSLVNILIVGSGRGGVTNDKGEFFLTGVPGGTYTVRASLLGYQVSEAKKIRIDPDETTVLDFKLASTTIEKEGITVEGARPLVDVKKTAGEQTYNKEKIEQLPNVKGVADVLGLQAGVVKFGSQLFLRGGRANETQILIDGVVANDVGGGVSATGGQSTNEQLAQLYSGNSAGGSGGALSVAANAIQSVSVSSSGLDAEYGNAQSGVVNITTKSGSDSYSATAQYRTDGITDNGFNERYYALNVGGPEPITQSLLPALGVTVPGKLSFFMSSTFNQSDGPYQWVQDEFFHPLQRKVRFSGFLGNVLNGFGFKYDDKQDNEFSYNAKLSYFVGDNDQFSYSYRSNVGSTHSVQDAYGWRARYDSSQSQLSMKTQNVFQWTHFLGTNSQVKAYVSRLETDNTNSVGGLTPDQYPIPVGSNHTTDPNGDGTADVSSGQGWSHNNTVIWNMKADYNAKVHEYHYLKTGFEYFYEDIKAIAIDYPKDAIRSTDTRGEYPGYGRNRRIVANMPSRGAIYAQDNIELTALTIKVGLRYDFFYLGKQVFNPDFISLWETVTGQSASWLDKKSFGSQFLHGNFSPRLAIGYPISERTVFYFNYGHFLQYPDRNYYFSAPIITNDAITVGNPSLKPQKTIQYEAGFDQLLADEVSLGIRGFYKDVFDYISPLHLNVAGDVTKWVNLDYASARGFEVILTKGGGGHYSGSIGYTFQLAKGRSADPSAALSSPKLLGLPREVRMDWDQEHTLNLFAGYRVAPREEYNVLGLNLNNWGASVTWTFGSGFPYTPFNSNKGLQDLYLKNTADGPYSSELNLSLYKGFEVLDKFNLVLTCDVTNLLNRRNVNLSPGDPDSPLQNGFNTLAGRVAEYGDYDPRNIPRTIYSWRGWGSSVPPFAFKAPRQITFGLKLNWN